MEEIKPIIAVLGGTGNEGPGLALRWADAGYEVIIGSRQLEKAQRIASEINVKLNQSSVTGLLNKDASTKADICVLTVVQTAHQTAIENLKDVLQGKILVDATARVDFRDPKPPSAPSAAEIAQNILGSGVRVVAAFQNVPAHSLRSIEKKISSEILVCSDDLDAAEEVIKLAKAAGMGAYYAGGLANAITVEGITSLLININKHYKVKTSSIRISGI
jgi:NADPH-dependent F420 reductase